MSVCSIEYIGMDTILCFGGSNCDSIIDMLRNPLYLQNIFASHTPP
jgi:hypothetical protein